MAFNGVYKRQRSDSFEADGQPCKRQAQECEPDVVDQHTPHSKNEQMSNKTSDGGSSIGDERRPLPPLISILTACFADRLGLFQAVY